MGNKDIKHVMVFWLVVALVALAPAAANAEGRGNCKVDPDTKVCDGNSPRVCKDDNGDQGRCSTRNGGCLCITSQEESQELQIGRATDSVKTMLNFAAVSQVVDLTSACFQFSRILTNFLDAKDRLASLRPMTVPDANLLNRVDFVLANLPQVATDAQSCGMTVDVSGITTFFVGIKFELAERLILDPDREE
jgi:hypothetical protein